MQVYAMKHAMLVTTALALFVGQHLRSPWIEVKGMRQMSAPMDLKPAMAFAINLVMKVI